MVGQRISGRNDHKSDSDYQEDATLFLSLPMCLSTCTVLLSLLISTLLFSLISVLWKLFSAETLSLTTDLVSRIQCSLLQGLSL